jgi:hypothetical protein
MRKLFLLLSIFISLVATAQKYEIKQTSAIDMYLPGGPGLLDSNKYVGLIFAGGVWTTRLFWGIDLVKNRMKYTDSSLYFITPTHLAAFGYVPGSRNITINGVQLDLSQDRNFTVTSAADSMVFATWKRLYKVRDSMKVANDLRYLQSFTELDPVYAAGIVNYYTKTAADARYLQSIDTGNISNFFLKVRAGLSAVAVTNNYNSLSNLPTIPAAQQNTDWTASSGITQLLNKPVYLDSFNLATRAYAQKIKDSLQANINGKLSVAVTAVNAGYGISGGNITNTGTHSVDSFSVASRTYAQKIKDSLQVNINTNTTAISTKMASWIAGYGLTGGTIADGQTAKADSFSIASRAYAQKIKDSLQVNINGKQATLVNQTNIKSINGTTLLGSGDLVVGGTVDTFTISTRAFRDKLKDSLQANINTNTTAINTKMANWVAGYGLTGGTVSDGQTAKADSFSIATRAYSQKIKDSLQVNITANTTAITGKQPNTTVSTGLTAAGTTQGTGLVLSGGYSIQEITTAASGTGVVLPTGVAGGYVAVVNRGANPVIVYPASGGTINGQSANAGFTLGVNNSVAFLAKSSTAWYTDDNFQGGDVSSADNTSVLTVNGIKGASVPSLASGFLKSNGTTWSFDNTTYLSNAVTSITPGWGLTPQTAIVSTGAPLVDSFSVASRARVQKPIDSLVGVLPNSTNALNIAGVNFSFGGPGTQRTWSIGVSLPGQVAQMTAASSAINTTETKLMNTASIAANQLTAGSTYTVVLYGTCTSTVANASNIRVRIGTAGTTSDAVVGLITPTAATSGTGVNFTCTFTLKVRTTGVGGTMAGNGFLMNNGTTGISSVADVVGTVQSITVNTTAANIISVWYVSAATTTTSTFQDGIIKCEKI